MYDWRMKIQIPYLYDVVYPRSQYWVRFSLFSILTNIVEISKVTELILFADDTNIFMSDSRLDIPNDRVNYEFCKIST